MISLGYSRFCELYRGWASRLLTSDDEVGTLQRLAAQQPTAAAAKSGKFSTPK
jgi:hypothetical protein